MAKAKIAVAAVVAKSSLSEIVRLADGRMAVVVSAKPNHKTAKGNAAWKFGTEYPFTAFTSVEGEAFQYSIMGMVIRKAKKAAAKGKR